MLIRGYDFADVHRFVEQERYIAHIKHKRKRGEPVVEECPVPGETRFPARRWVVERTLGLARQATQFARPLVQESQQLAGFGSIRLRSHFDGYGNLRIDTKLGSQWVSSAHNGLISQIAKFAACTGYGSIGICWVIIMPMNSSAGSIQKWV